MCGMRQAVRRGCRRSATVWAVNTRTREAAERPKAAVMETRCTRCGRGHKPRRGRDSVRRRSRFSPGRAPLEPATLVSSRRLVPVPPVRDERYGTRESYRGYRLTMLGPCPARRLRLRLALSRVSPRPHPAAALIPPPPLFRRRRGAASARSLSGVSRHVAPSRSRWPAWACCAPPTATPSASPSPPHYTRPPRSWWRRRRGSSSVT